MSRGLLAIFKKEFQLQTLKIVSAAIVAVSAAGGIILGVMEYADRVDIERTRIALEMHEAYRREMGTIQLIDDAQRNAIVDRQRCIQARSVDNKLEDMNCSNLTDDDRDRIYQKELDSAGRDSLREAIGSALKGEVIVNGKEAVRQYQFFDAVRVCTNEGICDDGAVIALFAKEMTAYLNEVCVYAEDQNGPLAELKVETMTLARFLLEIGTQKNIFWSEDLSRDQLFFCAYLREL